ncbi:class GN sortase [Emcibacter sp.]|uniref:class GN sortase n=1 Tax=Emcibacter sp. TaxID=1979954 RepID=UPI002AA819A5|nr:class GN sortase [Emcibacter sp.]
MTGRLVAGLCLILGLSILSDGLYMKAKARLAQYLLASSWQDTLSGGREVRPWSWADTWPVARLSFPTLNRSHIILAGASGRTMAFGPGHLSTSALPGYPGHSYVSAHRNSQFRDLQYLSIGDEILVQRPSGLWITYIIDDITIFDAGTKKLGLDLDVDRLSLITCYPFDTLQPNTPWRYMVSAYMKEETHLQKDI